MTFKPMTYLVSFTSFVLLFMGLGGYVAYGKFTEHFLVQSFLDATPIQVYVQADPQGPGLRWEDTVALQNGVSARIAASHRNPVTIWYSDEPAAGAKAIPLAAQERTEDLRIDRSGRYLYVRIFASSRIEAKESTWLCKFDLQRRRLLRRTSVNPIVLPAIFRP